MKHRKPSFGTMNLDRGDKSLTLNNAQVRIIRKLLREGLKQVDIAKRFGVSRSMISDIKHKKQYGHVEDYE